jgi:hypothetical protein
MKNGVGLVGRPHRRAYPLEDIQGFTIPRVDSGDVFRGLLFNRIAANIREAARLRCSVNMQRLNRLEKGLENYV